MEKTVTQQPARSADKLLTLAFLLLIGFLIALGLAYALPYGDSLKDLGSFLVSGMAADRGLDPYGDYPQWLTEFNAAAFPRNLNPPISVPAFQLLARLDPLATLRMWFALSVVAYLVSVFLLSRAYRRSDARVLIAWALALAGLWNTLDMGQIYVWLLLAAVGGWLLLRSGRYVPAGVLIGLVIAVKPNFVIWPALLLLGGYSMAALSAVFTAALLSAVPLLLYGPRIYEQWLGALPAPTAITTPTNASLFGPLARLEVSWLAFALGGALLLALAVWARRNRPRVETVSAFALVASILTSPIAWVGYTLFLLPVFFQRRWTRPMVITAVLLIVPYPVTWSWSGEARWPSVALASIYVVGVLLVLAELIREHVGVPKQVPSAHRARSVELG